MDLPSSVKKAECQRQDNNINGSLRLRAYLYFYDIYQPAELLPSLLEAFLLIPDWSKQRQKWHIGHSHDPSLKFGIKQAGRGKISTAKVVTKLMFDTWPLVGVYEKG